MERIKQALERAREERQLHGEVRSGRAADVPPVAAEISYTRTHTVEPPVEFLREQRVISAFEPGLYTESYKILRTQVLQRFREGNRKTLAITSANDDEGKTLTAINLAISLAQEVTHTVLLVDADLRHPKVHRYFGLDDCRGVCDYLTDDVPIDELLIHPKGTGNFVFLPGGNPVVNSAEMLTSPKMIQLVGEIKSRYPRRIVIFDLPPVLSASDAVAFAPQMDAALLVIGEGQTKAEDVRRAVELLQKTEVIGTALTKVHGLIPGESMSLSVLNSMLDNRIARWMITGAQNISRRLHRSEE